MDGMSLCINLYNSQQCPSLLLKGYTVVVLKSCCSNCSCSWCSFRYRLVFVVHLSSCSDRMVVVVLLAELVVVLIVACVVLIGCILV